MSLDVTKDQRFTTRRRCPICGGAENDPRGTDKRCWGYISSDGKFARCSRMPGSLPQGADELWPWPLFSDDPQLKTYDYRDESGRLLFQVVRKPGKKFLQRKPGASVDTWEWTTKGVRMVLYRLPELIAAITTASIVFIMEGEKDVDTAWDIGLVATCNPRGAGVGKWRSVEKQARELLGQSRVVVVQDNDEPGIKHARQVAGSLNANILVPPEPHKDFTDWILGGATTSDIIAAAEGATVMPMHVVSSSNGVAARASSPPPGNFGINLIQARGQNAAIAENVARLLSQHEDWNGGPRLDTYGDRIYWPTKRPTSLRAGTDGFKKSDTVAVQGWCIEQNVLAEIGTVDHGIRAAAQQNTFDSLIDWINALPPWDGIRRLDGWLPTYFGCKDDIYHRTTGRSWLRACVERALAPGLLVDIVPILIGSQKTNKNYAITTLFHSDRLDSPWLSTMNDFKSDKMDLKRLSTTRWMLHDDEFRARDPKMLDRIKSWVSMTDEQYLAKYENDLTVRLRRALLVCSTNEDQMLYDPTGNRRWITWRVGAIDIDALRRDRLQLFAEAKQSAPWREGLDFDLIAIETAHAEVVDPLRERLLRLATEPRHLFDGTRLPPVWSGWTSSDALSELLGVTPERADQSFAVRLGRAVTAVGGFSKRTGRGAGCIRFYRPPGAVSADLVRRDLAE